MEDIEQGKAAITTHPKLKDEEAEEDDTHSSKLSVAVGQSQLAGVTPPHESYEGYHRFDPTASWSPKEERSVVFKTDLMLLTWICLMVPFLPHFVSWNESADDTVLRPPTRPRQSLQCIDG
jgi:hypothetical protein